MTWEAFLEAVLEILHHYYRLGKRVDIVITLGRRHRETNQPLPLDRGCVHINLKEM